MMKELEGLNDDFVAWGRAGLDKDFTLFKIYTRRLTDTKTGEVGQFTCDARYDLSKFESFNDKVGLLKYICRLYLVHMHKTTGVQYEDWIIEFSPIMEKYQVPSHLYLDTARDRNWLL